MICRLRKQYPDCYCR